MAGGPPDVSRMVRCPITLMMEGAPVWHGNDNYCRYIKTKFYICFVFRYNPPSLLNV